MPQPSFFASGLVFVQAQFHLGFPERLFDKIAHTLPIGQHSGTNIFKGMTETVFDRSMRVLSDQQDQFQSFTCRRI